MMSKKANTNSGRSGRRPHVVIIGGGFGGLAAAKRLAKAKDGLDITLIDRRNHHLFQPLLYQVATSGLSAPDIAQPIRSILSRSKNVRVLMKRVDAIDMDRRAVVAEDEHIGYDFLVIAAGGRTSYFGNDQWESHAPGLKSLEDARTIRNNVLTAFEKAEAGGLDDEELRKLTTLVVVGAGPTGVEMAGSLAELAKRVLRRDFREVDLGLTRILLIEGLDRVLPLYPPELSAKAQKQLEELGVEVKLNERVRDIREDRVVLASGEEIEAANIIWTAGVRASALTGTLDVPKDRAGRLKVEPDCSLPGHPEVFAVGDISDLKDANGVQVPGVAQGAIQTALHAATIILREIRGTAGAPSTRPPFTYRNRGDMATIGRKRAVADIMGWRFSGPLAWFAWLAVHLVFLIGLRNRISVFLNWVYAYARFQYGSRIIWGAREDGADATDRSRKRSEAA